MVKRITGLRDRRTVEQAMLETGTTAPRAALESLRKTVNSKMSYLPHVGAKQRAKALKRAAQHKGT